MSVLTRDISNNRAIARAATASKSVERWLYDLQRTTATGATSTMTIADRFAMIGLWPEDFGAARDGVTDDCTALTNWLNAVAASPAKRGYMRSGTYACDGALPKITTSGVEIIAVGSSDNHDVGSATGTIIKATGATTGHIMLDIGPTEGASAQRLDAIKLDGITFDANGKAAKGVRVKSIRRSWLDLEVLNATAIGLELNVATTLGEGTSPQDNIIIYNGRQIETPGGISLVLDGDTNGNPSFNTFWVDIQHSDAVAIQHKNSDNNLWMITRTARTGGGSATNSIEWRGGASSALSCRDEHYEWLSVSHACIAKGTGTYTVGAQRIIISHLDVDNGSPSPTCETGARIEGIWLDYTPTLSSTTNTITTVGTCTGRYRIEDNKVFWKANCAITTNGTAAGKNRITLPANPGNVVGASYATGRASAVSGKMLLGYFTNGQQYVDVQNYDDTYPGANGETLSLSGWYEVS